MAAIALTDVTRSYRGVAALRDVSFDVPDGAFCVVTGPAGSGKSTLLRLIAGRERVNGGTIAIGDAVRVAWDQRSPDLAEVCDPRELLGRKNLYDNIARGLRRRGLTTRDVEARALAAADAMALGPLLARKAGQVSADERWRTAFARALAHRPPALLFDEPLEGADTLRRMALRREIRRVQRETGATTVFATRDPADALALADLLVVLHDGAVVQAGAPEELYREPQSTLAAGLTGPFGMNVLPVRGNQTGLSLEDGTWLGAASVMPAATFGFLGIRPEHLFVLDGGEPPPNGARLPLLVETVERTGADVFVHGHVGPHPVVARLAGGQAVVAGEKLMVGATRENLHMFEAESGRRL